MNSGSPLTARLEFNFSAFFFVVAIIVVFIVIIGLITRYLRIYRDSAAYLEKRKNAPTKTKDIVEVSKKAKLSKTEYDYLSYLIKLYKIPNLKYFLKDPKNIDSYLKEQYKLLDKDMNELGKTTLFNLRTKLFKTFGNQILIKNSRLIPLGTYLTFTPSQGIHYQFLLSESNQEELYLTLPSNFIQPDEKPAILSKIDLIFVHKDSSPYKLETRVIRYQKGKNNSDLIVCTQSDKITLLPKRESERIELMKPCVFCHAKTSQNNQNNYDLYIPSEQKHNGTLADISAGGCRILTNLPIKSGQYIFIEGPLDNKNLDKALGIIVRTSQTKYNTFVLHVKFLKITEKTKNSISAITSNYKNIED